MHFKITDFRVTLTGRRYLKNDAIPGLQYFAKRNETKRNGILRNGTLRNGSLRNGTLRNGTLRNGTLRNGYNTMLNDFPLKAEDL